MTVTNKRKVHTGDILAHLASVLRPLSGVAVTTAIVQGLSFVSGILVIRAVSVPSYAMYSLANMMTGLLNTLSDSGLSIASLALAGRHYGDFKKQGAILTASRSLLKVNGAFSLLAVLPLWAWASVKHAESTMQLLIIGACICSYMFCLLGSNVYRSILLVHHRLSATQAIDIASNFLRVLLLLPALHYSPSAQTAVCVSFLSELPRIFAFRRLAHEFADPNGSITCDDVRVEIRSILRKTMPTAVYNAAASQIQFTLLAFLGSTAAVASAGALTRLNQLFMVVPAFSAGVLAPQLSREKRAERLKKVFLTAIGKSAGLAIIISAAIVVWPHAFLWALGPKYFAFTMEARLMALSSLVGCIGSVLSGMQAARGYIIPPAKVIVVNLLSLLVAGLLLPIDRLSGFLWLQLIVNTSAMALNSIYAVRFYRKLLPSESHQTREIRGDKAAIPSETLI